MEGEEWNAGAARKAATQVDALYPGASATPAARQRTGNPSIAQGSGQASAIPELSLKNLAHAGGAALQRTVDTVMGQLAGAWGGENVARGTVEQLMQEGRELQRTANFTDQNQARVWTLRVLAWVANIISLGIVPGLANLFARDSASADSFMRYSFGSGEFEETQQERLRQFNNLFEKFKTLGEQAEESVRLEHEDLEARKVNTLFMDADKGLQDSMALAGKLTSSNAAEGGNEAAGQAIRTVFPPNGNSSFSDVISNLRSKLSGNIFYQCDKITSKAMGILQALRKLEERAKNGESIKDNDVKKEESSYTPKKGMDFQDEMRGRAQHISDLAGELKKMLKDSSEVQAAQDKISDIQTNQSLNKADIARTKARIVDSIGRLSGSQGACKESQVHDLWWVGRPGD
jgi:hypothetical protein